jgi:PAS domain S-box-containing protein
MIVSGVAFAAFHITHLIADIREGSGTLALLTGAVLPFLLAISIAGAGYYFWTSDLHPDELRYIDVWVLSVTVGMTVIGGAFLWYALLEGAFVAHLHYLLVDFATTGAVGGCLVGWYDAQRRERTRQLRTFRAAVDNAGHSVYLTAPDGTIEYVNPAFESQTGYDRTEALGANPRILKSGEQDDSFYEDMWETILSGGVWNEELVNERKDGTRYHVDQTIAPVTDRHGEIKHFVAVNNDITEQKAYEAELKRRNRQLDEFASVVSHDLRNPMNVAMTRTELAHRDCESEHLEAVQRSLERMERLIDDVLTLSRQGETVDETEAVPLRTLCERAWRQIEAPEATLSVEEELSLVADASRTQQLLENLFRNAIEHGGEGVIVRAGTCDGGFYVEDTGDGFDDGVADQVFESGYTTSDEGTGLGLTIVRRIADGHGWEITATEGADGGARFEITGVEAAPDTVSWPH